MLSITNHKHQAAVLDICEWAHASGGRALVVGGAVRDSILGLEVKDIDIEVYSISLGLLLSLLGERYVLDLVGEAFGIIKIHGLPIDVYIPRRPSQPGLGQESFMGLSDPTLTVEQAAAGRDFSINSMAYDPLQGCLIDPFHGLTDLKNKVLRHTSERFVEDPLRVLRGMQFAARFDLSADEETVALARSLGMEGLTPERIFEEWRKLITRGTAPSRGLDFLRRCGWLRFFPELDSLVAVPQEPEWHPEGDVWQHTLCCLDAFARELTLDGREDLVVGLAVLCHDLGKPLTTSSHADGRIRSLGHEEAGEQPTRGFLSRMTRESALIDEVVALVVNHLKPTQLFESGAGDSAVRRLAARVRRIDRLVRVARADHQGRPPTPSVDFPAGRWLEERARELGVRDAAPRPILMGRHLIRLGLTPGPIFGVILRACYEAQLEGKIVDEKDAMQFAEGLAPSPQ